MVKKITLVCGIALVLSVLATVMVVSPALADSPDPAVVFHTCPGTPFLSSVGGFTFSYCFDDVVTPSGNANANFHGDLVAGSTAPSQATKVTGFGCTAGFPTGDRFTTDTQLVVTPSGEVNGTCKFTGWPNGGLSSQSEQVRLLGALSSGAPRFGEMGSVPAASTGDAGYAFPRSVGLNASREMVRKWPCICCLRSGDSAVRAWIFCKFTMEAFSYLCSPIRVWNWELGSLYQAPLTWLMFRLGMRELLGSSRGMVLLPACCLSPLALFPCSQFSCGDSSLLVGADFECTISSTTIK